MATAKSVLALALLLAMVQFPVALADAPAPAAQWHLDEWREGTFSDASGNGLDGVTGAAGSTEGVVGNALSYYTSYDFSTVPDDPLLRPSSLTVMFWLKPLELRDCGIMAKREGSTDACNWQVEMLSTGNVRFSYFSGGWQTVDSERVLVPYEWNHVAVTFESGTACIYIGGSLAKQETGLPPLDTASTGNLTIGSNPSGYMRADIDEISVYGSALTASEIASASTVEEEGLVLSTGQKALCWAAAIIVLPILAYVMFALISPSKVVALDIGKKPVNAIAAGVLLFFVLFIIATVTHQVWAPEPIQPFFKFVLDFFGPFLVFILGSIAIGGMWWRAVAAGYRPSAIKAPTTGPAVRGVDTGGMVLEERGSQSSATGKEYVWRKK